jgi:hypothetical protein
MKVRIDLRTSRHAVAMVQTITSGDDVKRILPRAAPRCGLQRQCIGGGGKDEGPTPRRSRTILNSLELPGEKQTP